MIFTENAAERVKEIIVEDKEDVKALRVFVQGGGCHGFSYVLVLRMISQMMIPLLKQMM